MSKCICGEINARNCPVHQQSEIEQLEVENKHLRTLALNPVVVNQYDENKKLRAANEVLRDGLKEALKIEDELCAVTVSGILKSALESADKILKGE